MDEKLFKEMLAEGPPESKPQQRQGMNEPGKRICPLLMLARAARRKEEIAPVSSYCQESACAWWRNTFDYFGKRNGGRCAVLEIALKHD